MNHSLDKYRQQVALQYESTCYTYVTPTAVISPRRGWLLNLPINTSDGRDLQVHGTSDWSRAAHFASETIVEVMQRRYPAVHSGMTRKITTHA